MGVFFYSVRILIEDGAGPAGDLSPARRRGEEGGGEEKGVKRRKKEGKIGKG